MPETQSSPGKRNSPTCRGLNRWDVLTAILAALTIVSFVLAWAWPVWPGDEALLKILQGRRSIPLDTAFRAASFLGWYPVAAGLTAAALAVLLLRRLWEGGLLLASVMLAVLPAYGLKWVVGRDRPEYAIFDQVPQSMSFPSGHAAFAMLLGGVLVYLAYERVEAALARWALVAGLALAVVAVGVSRVYLGLHWPSDIAGAYLYGATIVAVAVRVRYAVSRRSTVK